LTLKRQLFELTLVSARTPANVTRRSADFIVETVVGQVRVTASELARLDDTPLKWPDSWSRQVYAECLETFLASRLPEPAPSAKKLSWWRRLWLQLLAPKLPRARLIEASSDSDSDA
jgi:hypothetical protein